MIPLAMCGVTELIRYQALIAPDKISVKSKHWDMTYKQLTNVIDGLKFRLRESGIKHGSTVNVALESSVFSTFLLSLALMDLGCNYASGSATNNNAVAPDILITDSVKELNIHQILFSADWLDETRRISKLTAQLESPGNAYFATSGTLGTKKVVKLSQEQLAMRVQAHSFAFGHAVIGRQWGSLVGCGSLFGYLSLLSPLIRGSTLVLNSGSVTDSNSNLDAIEHLNVSPQILELFLDDENLTIATFRSLKSIMVSGSTLPPVLLQKSFSKLGVEVYSSYGSTEVGPVANLQLVEGIQYDEVAGYVYPWIELEIVDEDRPVPAGEEGHVRIRSPYMAKQYHDDIASTERAYKDGWFYPGDQGRLSESRLLHLTGRVNEVINIGGLKIAPHRIEHLVRSHPYVRDAAAFGNISKNGLDEVWLAVVSSGPIDFNKLHEKCVEQFGPVAAPVRILHVTWIPRTENGKIQRSILREVLTKDSKPSQLAL